MALVARLHLVRRPHRQLRLARLTLLALVYRLDPLARLHHRHHQRLLDLLLLSDPVDRLGLLDLVDR